MSYILDALRKADAERDRGSVPGLHAQTSPASAEDASPQRLPPWTWAAGGAALMLIAAMAWQLMGRDGDAPARAVAAAPAQAPVTPAPMASAQVAASPPVLASPAPVQARSPAPAVPRPAPVAATSVSRESVPLARKPEPAVQKAAAAVAPTDSASAAEDRVYALNELPADVRRDLPSLKVGGSIYSDNAASRFLIINGQIFHENDKVAPNLTLEQIKLKAAVLKYKGYRYTIGF